MPYENETLITLIHAGELRASSYVSVKLPYGSGMCTGILNSDGTITFGFGGRSRPFSLNEFVRTIFGRYSPNAWISVRDEHGDTLDEVRARYERATGHRLKRRHVNARRSHRETSPPRFIRVIPPREDRREPIDTSERMVGIVVRDRNGERVIST